MFVEHKQVRSSILCAKNSIRYRHALEYVQQDRAKCDAFVLSSPLVKPLNIFEKMECLSLVDTSFASRDSPRPVLLFWPCHPLPLVMGVTTIPNIHSLTT